MDYLEEITRKAYLIMALIWAFFSLVFAVPMHTSIFGHDFTFLQYFFSFLLMLTPAAGPYCASIFLKKFFKEELDYVPGTKTSRPLYKNYLVGEINDQIEGILAVLYSFGGMFVWGFAIGILIHFLFGCDSLIPSTACAENIQNILLESSIAR